MASGKQIISLLVPGYSRLRTKLLLCNGAMGSDGGTFTVNYCECDSHETANGCLFHCRLRVKF
jgi:hypothetical protein